MKRILEEISTLNFYIDPIKCQSFFHFSNPASYFEPSTVIFQKISHNFKMNKWIKVYLSTCDTHFNMLTTIWLHSLPGTPEYWIFPSLWNCAVLRLVAQLCLTLRDPMDWIACQAPLSMVILQARILEWVAMSSSRGSFRSRNGTGISNIAGGFFTS